MIIIYRLQQTSRQLCLYPISSRKCSNKHGRCQRFQRYEPHCETVSPVWSSRDLNCLTRSSNIMPVKPQIVTNVLKAILFSARNTHALQARRYYSSQSGNTPFRPDQTTVNLDKDHHEQTLTAVNNVAGFTTSSYCAGTPVSQGPFATNPGSKIFRRKLGSLESMYYMYTMNRSDVGSIITRVETVYPISEDNARDAWISLHERHPLFRMMIETCPGSTNGELAFFERKSLTYDFHVSKRSDWLDYSLEEVNLSFNDNRLPLLKCRMLNPSTAKETTETGSSRNESNGQSGFNYQATFLFVVHHSICDAAYCLWLFQDYISFIDALSTGHTIGKINELPVYPPVDALLSPHTVKLKKFTAENIELSSEYSVQFDNDCPSDDIDMVITDYNRKYKNDIKPISSLQRPNGWATFELSESETKGFIQGYKAHGCTANGVIFSACVLSLLDIIYGDEELKNVKVPLEYMVDLRRYSKLSDSVDIEQRYPGLATTHVPLIVSLSRVKGSIKSAEEFWSLTTVIGNYISDDSMHGDLVNYVREEYEKFVKCPQYTLTVGSGKSPFVLCVTNMGVCNHVLHDNVSTRVRLTDLQVNTTISGDDSPLFYPITYTFKGRLHGVVNFCNSYTSMATAENYVTMIKKYLTRFTK